MECEWTDQASSGMPLTVPSSSMISSALVDVAVTFMRFDYKADGPRRTINRATHRAHPLASSDNFDILAVLLVADELGLLHEYDNVMVMRTRSLQPQCSLKQLRDLARFTPYAQAAKLKRLRHY